MTIRLRADLSQLEQLEREFLDRLNALGISDTGLATELLFVINEAFTNSLRHGDSKGKEITIDLDLASNNGDATLTMTIEDFGSGIRLNGAPPPYPPEFFDREFILAETIDGSVIATVTGPSSMQIAFREAPKTGEAFERIVDRLKFGGMGMSIISKVMDSVEYEHEPDRNFLMLKKQIQI